MRALSRWACAVVVASLMGACVPPPTPAERLSDTAHELAMATRFGRLDIALSHVKAEQQLDFARRHAKWGKDIRIVDVELMGLRLLTPERAEVQIAVSWHRIDETIIRTSVLAQEWEMGEKNWNLTVEQRTGGDAGIFVEPRRKPRDKKPPRKSPG